MPEFSVLSSKSASHMSDCELHSKCHSIVHRYSQVHTNVSLPWKLFTVSEDTKLNFVCLCHQVQVLELKLEHEKLVLRDTYKKLEIGID